MARLPPQRLWPRRARLRAARASRTVAYGLLCLMPLAAARAARSCEDWSAEITAVEGRAEVLRSAATQWLALASGDRLVLLGPAEALHEVAALL